MSNIDLLLDEENELTFALTVEGTRPATAQCRLVLENEGMSFVFNSEPYSGDEVKVVLPPLKHVLKEGEYDMNLEVIVEDKYFKPLSLVGNFEKSIEIKAAPVQKAKKKGLMTSASLSEVRVKNTSTRKVKETTTERKIEKKKVSDKEILAIIEALSKGKI
jgi:hypothetical protein